MSQRRKQENTISQHGHPLFYEKLGWVYILNNQNREAIDILEKPIKKFSIRPTQTLALLSEAYHKTGQNEKAKLILEELDNKVNKDMHNTAVYLAMTYASIGEKEKALKFLDKAFELHDRHGLAKSRASFQIHSFRTPLSGMLKKVGF